MDVIGCNSECVETCDKDHTVLTLFNLFRLAIHIFINLFIT
ncbi:MAG: hypothetical protein ACI8RD_003113 [Bacillariaceae sp.]|jgi:hypothetical protein